MNEYSGVNISEEVKNELLKQRLTEKIDEFVKEKYTPHVVKGVIGFLSENSQWKQAISTQNHDAISKMIEVTIIEVMSAIEDYRNKLVEPIGNLNEGPNSNKAHDAEKRIDQLIKDNE